MPKTQDLPKAFEEYLKVKEFDFSKVETWIGDTRRSDFEFYKDIIRANNTFEKFDAMRKTDFGSLDSSTKTILDSLSDLFDVFSVFVENKFNLNKEKGFEIFFDQMEDFIPKRDTWTKYP